MSLSAQAITVVAPNQQSNTGLSTGLNDADRTYQMQFGSNLLTGINVGDSITGLTFRISSNQVTPSSPASSFTDYEIYLAEAANAISSMSNTFANNMINSVQVRDGGLSFDEGDFQGGALNPNTNPFGPVINFSTPYTYLGGDLVVLISHTPGSATIGFLDALTTSAPGYGTDFQAFSAGSFGATTGSQQAMTITQFTVAQAQPIPEPVTILGTLASLGFGFVFKKKQSSK